VHKNKKSPSTAASMKQMYCWQMSWCLQMLTYIYLKLPGPAICSCVSWLW